MTGGGPKWGGEERDGGGGAVTAAERTTLLNANYQQQQSLGYNCTASGFATYIREAGVNMAKGTLRSKFLPGTPYTLSPRGTTLIYH